MKYYYLIASLPHLDIEEKPSISSKEFIGESRKWLTGTDFDRLSLADMSDYEAAPGDTKILREWKAFDFNLRQQLKEVREARRQSEHVQVPTLLKRVFDKATPLEMEDELAGIRWKFAEAKETFCDFDINRLMMYYLRLQIAERIGLFDKKKGMESFESLCEEKV